MKLNTTILLILVCTIINFSCKDLNLKGSKEKGKNESKNIDLEIEKDAAGKKPNIFFFFADDWGKYASTYQNFAPNKAFQTPALDKFAKEGVQFNNANVNSPSCTPCRSSLLSGQYFYRTGLAANLWGVWDPSIPSYPLILEEAGYHIGFTYKCWGPGTPIDAPYGGIEKAYMSAGIRFNTFSQNVTKMVKEGKSLEVAKDELYDEGLDNFRSFLKTKKDGQPFCYWFGPTNTHRKWVKGSGKDLWGLSPENLKGNMPEFLPDVPDVREDMTDYFGEVLALDEMLGLFLEELEAIGERENTIIVISGDHGIPGFPRAKCNLYPLGTDVPLLVQWSGGAPGNRKIDDFISLMDLAPTFLEVAGIPTPNYMDGKSIIPLLKSDKNGTIDEQRSYVVTGRERHGPVARDGNLPYPQRAIKSKDFLYIMNFAPDRYPVGTPYHLDGLEEDPTYEVLKENTRLTYGDLDAGPTKAWMIQHRKDKEWAMHWRLGFEKRPAEELYDLSKDPDYLNNVAYTQEYSQVKDELSKKLIQVLNSTGDPRVTGEGKIFDQLPYTSLPK